LNENRRRQETKNSTRSGTTHDTTSRKSKTKIYGKIVA
jgi:hypothetical protein